MIKVDAKLVKVEFATECNRIENYDWIKRVEGYLTYALSVKLIQAIEIRTPGYQCNLAIFLVSNDFLDMFTSFLNHDVSCVKFEVIQ